jgi:imidazolonepropionase-like amidohydrolase
MDGIISAAKTALENGIPVGLGTDSGCPFITHYDMWRELDYFHKYVGVSNAFALYTATKRNAEILGIADVTGSIEVGKSADFLITDANPLEKISALRTPYMVVACGKRFERPKVKKYANVEKELDKWL